MCDYDFETMLFSHANGTMSGSVLKYRVFAYALTPNQITKLCEHVLEFSTAYMLADMVMSDSDIDLLISSRSWSDRWDIAAKFRNLNAGHIWRLLNDEIQHVREVAYKHPNCTEAMKVAYNLKWGD